jgi:DNA-binding helix-hairpin-helix protein with protein kinase domain
MGSRRQIIDLIIAIAAIAIPIVLAALKAARKQREEQAQRLLRAQAVTGSAHSGASPRPHVAPESDDAEDAADLDDTPGAKELADLRSAVQAVEQDIERTKAAALAMAAESPRVSRAHETRRGGARAALSGHPLLAGSPRAGFVWSVVLGKPGGRGSI